MSTTFNPLTVGIQHLYKYGLLPSTLSVDALNKSAANQAAKIANSTVALKQATALFGTTASSDTATLSTTATNALTQAVSNQLTYGVNTAADKFVPKSAASPVIEDTGGSQINVLA